MKRLYRWLIITMIVTGLFGLNMRTAAAADVQEYKQVGDANRTTRIGKRIFTCCFVDKMGYQLVITEKGKKAVLIKNMDEYMFTNGRYLIYTTDYLVRELNESAVYRLDLVTGRKTALFTGGRYTVRGALGNYIYYGIDQDVEGVDLNAYDIRTKRSKFMTKMADLVIVLKNHKLVVTHHANDLDNYMTYRFNENGTGKKNFVKATAVYTKDKYIYWTEIDSKTYNDTVRLCRCSLNGKKKEKVTDYVTFEEMEKVLKHYKLIK